MEKVSKAWFKRLSKFTQEEWELQLLKIENEQVRTRVARIIFWDFFDNRKPYEKTFRKYLKRIKIDIPDKDVLTELSRIYPPEVAEKRLGMDT